MSEKDSEQTKEKQPSDTLSDEELVSLIVNGDKQAYSLLVQRYLNKIWRLAMSILHNEQEAEDAVQEVFLTLWQKLEQWDTNGKAKFSTWIYRVSFNKCIDIKRKRKPTEDSDQVVLPDSGKTAYQDILQNELSKKLSNLLKDLPEMQSMALLLYYYEELSVEEISVKLEKTEQSVRSLLKRGRAKKKKKMQYDQAFQSWDISGLSEHLWR